MNDSLRSSILRFIKKRYPYLIFFLLSLAPFAWHSNLFQVQFIGSADYLSPYVTPEWIAQTTSVYGPQVGGGGDYAYLLAYLFLYSIPVRILHALGMSGPVISISILSAMIFVSQLSMFLFVRYVIQEKLHLKNISVNLLSTFSAIFYGFSPYLVGIIAPGHIFQIYSYMLFPLLLLYVDKFLSAKYYSWRYLAVLYYIFFLSSPAFANIGILYVTFLILGVYYLLFNILNRKTFVKTTVKTFLIFLSTILANIWWILPYAANFGKAIAVNQASTVINKAVDASVKDASIVNIFFGRAESLFYEDLGNTYYSNGIIFLLFTGLLLLAFIPYITKAIKKGYLYILSLLLLLGAFITKGPNEPFGFLFNWMYYTIPGFQIFRRPVSKFYWFFLLILFTLAIIGASIILAKTKKKIVTRTIIGFLTIVSAYFVIAFVRTPLLIPFNVPDYYDDAKQYLEETHAQRILMLPGFYGTYPTYNETINNYYGVDFIPYIWPYQILVPDSTNYSSNTPTKTATYNIIKTLVQNKSLCASTKKLGITHIVLRQDINKNAVTEGEEEELFSLLIANPTIQERKTFQTSNTPTITIFKIKNECSSSGLVYSDKGKISYDVKDPTKLYGTFQSNNSPTTISLLLNSNNNWRMYLLTSSEKFIPLLTTFRRYTEVEKNNQSLKTANMWTLSEKKNLQESQGISFVLYYTSQNYLYLGLIIFFLLNITITILIVRNRRLVFSQSKK